MYWETGLNLQPYRRLLQHLLFLNPFLWFSKEFKQPELFLSNCRKLVNFITFLVSQFSWQEAENTSLFKSGTLNQGKKSHCWSLVPPAHHRQRGCRPTPRTQYIKSWECGNVLVVCILSSRNLPPLAALRVLSRLLKQEQQKKKQLIKILRSTNDFTKVAIAKVCTTLCVDLRVCVQVSNSLDINNNKLVSWTLKCEVAKGL